MLCLQCHNYIDIKRSEQAGARCKKIDFCFGIPRQLSCQNKMLVFYISEKTRILVSFVRAICTHWTFLQYVPYKVHITCILVSCREVEMMIVLLNALTISKVFSGLGNPKHHFLGLRKSTFLQIGPFILEM